jgi:enoyl-CoA hydratase/carnithine racemase
MSGTVSLEIAGKIATITNHNPDKHNAFDDEMDAQLFEILAELRVRPDVRAVIWQGEGKSFSSGRDDERGVDFPQLLDAAVTPAHQLVVGEGRLVVADGTHVAT